MPEHGICGRRVLMPLGSRRGYVPGEVGYGSIVNILDSDYRVVALRVIDLESEQMLE